MKPIYRRSLGASRNSTNTRLLLQVAFKRFVDDIAVEAVETNIIAKIDSILSPVKVTHLDTEVVTSVAGESEESRVRRRQLTNQLDVLVQGLETCKKFIVGTLQGTYHYVSRSDFCG
jgi:hypothetical protein